MRILKVVSSFLAVFMLYGCVHPPASDLSVSQQVDLSLSKALSLHLTPSPPSATHEIKYVEPTDITYSPTADTSPTRLFIPIDTNTASTPATTIPKIPSSSPTLEKVIPSLTNSLSTLPTLITETRQPNIQDVPTATTSPTKLFIPTDTNTASTPAATISKIPSSSPTVEKVIPTTIFSVSTLHPLATERPQPNMWNSPIQIFGPGERSKVTPPIQIEAQLASNTGRLVRIELRGAGGRLLARQVKILTIIPGSSADISVKLFYEINMPTEAGRLTISVDDQHGRTMDLNSVNILLLPTGAAELMPASAIKQLIVIQEPTAGKSIKDGMVLVSGLARTDLRHPLKVELISEDGMILGQRLATNPQSTSEAYGVFTAEVPYWVTGPTPARLIIFEDEDNRDEITHLSSVEIILKP